MDTVAKKKALVAKRRYVQLNRARWEGQRAMYREGTGLTLIRLSDININDGGVRATCTSLPFEGLRVRPPSWRIRIDWAFSSFADDSWGNGMISMTMWFDPELIDATLRLVSELHAAEDGADHSERAWRFISKYRRIDQP